MRRMILILAGLALLMSLFIVSFAYNTATPSGKSMDGQQNNAETNTKPPKNKKNKNTNANTNAEPTPTPR